MEVEGASARGNKERDGMGITIHYRFGIYDEGSLEKVLKEAKEMAESLNLDVRFFRLTKKEKVLIINPDENSETINLEFQKWRVVKGRIGNGKDWDYAYDVMKHYFNDIPSDMWVCASFTKTQFAGDITHVRVAEILRRIASHCSLVKIHDEAGYYETKDREKMLEAFGECSKLINSIVGMLKEAGWKEENIVRGGY